MARRDQFILDVDFIRELIKELKLCETERLRNRVLAKLIRGLCFLSMADPDDPYDILKGDEKSRIQDLCHLVISGLKRKSSRPTGRLQALYDAQTLSELGREMTRTDAARHLQRQSRWVKKELSLDAARKRVDRAVRDAGLVGIRPGRPFGKTES